MRISKRTLDDLRRTPPAARTVHWDDDLKGFGARLTPDGSASFILKYRVRGEPRQRFLTLGDYPTVNPDRARDEARRIKSAASMGEDMIAQREEERREAEEAAAVVRRQAVPLGDLLAAWRATIAATIARNAAAGRSTRYEVEMLRYEEARLRPLIQDMTVGSFDPAVFQAILFRQPSIYVARNLRSVIVRFVRFANSELVIRGLKTRWPLKYEVEGSVVARSDRYTLEQAARIWIAAGRLGRRGVMLRFMLLTGCRLTEACHAEWSHLRLEDSVLGPHWEQPGNLTKNHKPHRVPLTDALVALLRWLPPRKIRGKGEIALIFSGRGGKPIAGLTAVREAMREEAGLVGGTLHDMRRTMVSTLGDHGFDPQVADTLLNHVATGSMPGVMGIYQRSEFWLKRREAIDAFAGLLLAEVERIEGKPINRSTWGLDQPFADVRIIRKVPAKKPVIWARKAAS